MSPKVATAGGQPAAGKVSSNVQETEKGLLIQGVIVGAMLILIVVALLTGML